MEQAVSYFPSLPWTYRQPFEVPPEIIGELRVEFVDALRQLVDGCPIAWRDGAEAFARNWMEGYGLNPNEPEQLRAFLLGAGLVGVPPDLTIGLASRFWRLKGHEAPL